VVVDRNLNIKDWCYIFLANAHYHIHTGLYHNQNGMNGQDEDDSDFETIRGLGFDLALYKV